MQICSHIRMRNETGATAVYVAVVLTVLLMFTALGIDVGHLYGVRNELHNAADAAALAGAANLFNDDGSLNGPAAIAEAERIASLNRTGNQYVVSITAEPGHWSFVNRTFTAAASDDPEQVDWQEQSFSDLDSNIDFINAVRVRADRTDTPSFFARILGFADFFVSADAVAYIGFAGTIMPGELDQPIAICQDSITDADGRYSCNMGRMLNSGGNASTSMTAMWTNYSQPCSAANNSDMQDLTGVCSATNLNTINLGDGIGSQNGVQDNILGNVSDCWEAAADSDGDGVPDSFWPLTLPVIECGVDNTCAPLVGAVKVNVVWIQHKNDPITQMNEVPTKMEDWSCTTTATLEDRFACWKSFVDHFDLANASGPPVTDQDYEDMYQKKNIFFLPSCEEHRPSGVTGGENFGILAEYPLLVE